MRKFKFNLVIFIIIAVIVFFNQDWDDSSSTKPQAQPQIVQKTIKPSPAAKPDIQLAPWPMLNKDAADQQISDNLAAKNYYFVIDGSGSMRNIDCSGAYSKMDAAKIALTEFARNIPNEANIGIVAFDRNSISERLALQQKNEGEFNYAVQQIGYGGGTPLQSAIDIAYTKVTEQGRKQLGYGEYNIIVVTDGAASEGEDPTRVINRIIDNTPILVHTIGFCLGEDHSLNQPGRTFYKAANNIESLRQGLDDILAESEEFTITDFN